MFSIVAPIDADRLDLFVNTKRVYDSFSEPHEFILPTRSEPLITQRLSEENLMGNVRVIPYRHDAPGFNPSRALNLGAALASYSNIVITCPEVKPVTSVLSQLTPYAEAGESVICQVFDAGPDGSHAMSLVNSGFRSDTPGMYFLAMFQKSHLQIINGWDEEFMRGYAWEDTDFGERWNRANIPFVVDDEILAVHQWHERLSISDPGWDINYRIYLSNANAKLTSCALGLDGAIERNA